MLTASYMQVPFPPYRTISEEEWKQSIPLDAPNVIPAGATYQHIGSTGFLHDVSFGVVRGDSYEQ